MKQVDGFDIGLVDINNIVFAITSELEYEMDRIYVIEDTTIEGKRYYGTYLVLCGGHCWWWGFSEVKWDATELNGDEELFKFFSGWANSGIRLEKATAEFMFGYDTDIKRIGEAE